MKFLILVLAFLKLVSSQENLIEAQAKSEFFKARIRADIRSDVGKILSLVKNDVQDAAEFFAQNNFTNFSSQLNVAETLIDQIATPDIIEAKLDEAFEYFSSTVANLYPRAALGIQESTCPQKVSRSLQGFASNVQKGVTRAIRSLRKEYEIEVNSKRSMLQNAFATVQNKVEACNSKRRAKVLKCKAKVIEDSGPKVSTYIALVKKLVPDLVNLYFSDVKKQLDSITQNLEAGFNHALNIPC